MTIFARYIFRQSAGALLLILLSLAGIVWIALALRELNVVTTEGQSAWTLFKITTLALPNLIAIIAPFALLVAVTHTLNRLNGDSELIVLTASGAPVWTVARPLLLLALLVSLGVAFVNHIGMPWSLRQLRDSLVQMRADLLTQVIQPGRFNSPEQGLTFHIRERALNGELLGLVMHDQRNPKQIQSYLAERGIIVKQGTDAYLVMSDGHIMRSQVPGDEPPRIIAFQKYAVDLDRFEQRSDDEEADLKPRERYFDELVHPDPQSAAFKLSPGRFRSELHERFSNPLYPFAFVFMALAAAGQAQTTRQNRVLRLAFAFVLAVAARLAGLAVNNLVVLEPAATPFLYGLPVVAGLVSLVVIRRAARPKGGAPLSEQFLDAMAPLFAWRPGRRPASLPPAKGR